MVMETGIWRNSLFWIIVRNGTCSIVRRNTRNATMKLVSLLMLSMLLVTSHAFGEPEREPTLEELQRMNASEDATLSINRLEALSERLSTTKRQKCMNAIGQEVFCTCLVNKTPLSSTFEQYIAAVDSSDEELAHLTPDDKELVALNRRARNECVNASQK